MVADGTRQFWRLQVLLTRMNPDLQNDALLKKTGEAWTEHSHIWLPFPYSYRTHCMEPLATIRMQFRESADLSLMA